ncbi:hypothetical protein S83_027204 [Arachis hypogaea]
MPRLQLHNNCLSVCHSTPDMQIICTLWIMKEYGVEESWIKLIEIPFDVGMNARCDWVAPLLYISQDHNLFAIDEYYRKFLVYNLSQNQLNQLVSQVAHGGYNCMIIFFCHESLVSPSHYSPPLPFNSSVAWELDTTQHSA